MTRVKVCGITGPDDLDTVASAGADAVGFTVDVSVDTPREIGAERAAALVSSTQPFVTTVLVTMPETTDRALELTEHIQPDVIQVHGGLTPGEIETLAEDTPADIVKAVSPEDAARFDTVADALLVDSLDASGAGGTGETHDWDRTHGLVTSLDSPVILAGGLTPENVAEAVDRVHPFAVDVASGVESQPGRKDPDAVASFVRRAGARP